MKKLFALLVITSVISLGSCKKDNNVKPAIPQPTVKAQEKGNTGLYDYQKAILVKRTLNVN